MLLTAGEALRKWCPFVRIGMMGTDAAGKAAEINLPAFNRFLKTTGEPNEASGSVSTTFCRCIASDCMMWQWKDGSEFTPPEHHGGFLPKGYCGLAGKPK